MKQNLKLFPVDENWCCDSCDISFKYSEEPDFAFCPNCVKALKNDMYQKTMELLMESLK